MPDDQRLMCVGCKTSFVWTGLEQRDAALREWWPKGGTRRPPRRCVTCREAQARIERPRCPFCGGPALDRHSARKLCGACGRGW